MDKGENQFMADFLLFLWALVFSAYLICIWKYLQKYEQEACKMENQMNGEHDYSEEILTNRQGQGKSSLYQSFVGSSGSKSSSGCSPSSII
jgi:hypothetical protein